jgi:hypothetical protein
MRTPQNLDTHRCGHWHIQVTAMNCGVDADHRVKNSCRKTVPGTVDHKRSIASRPTQCLNDDQTHTPDSSWPPYLTAQKRRGHIPARIRLCGDEHTLDQIVFHRGVLEQRWNEPATRACFQPADDIVPDEK